MEETVAPWQATNNFQEQLYKSEHCDNHSLSFALLYIFKLAFAPPWLFYKYK